MAAISGINQVTLADARFYGRHCALDFRPRSIVWPARPDRRSNFGFRRTPAVAAGPTRGGGTSGSQTVAWQSARASMGTRDCGETRDVFLHARSQATVASDAVKKFLCGRRLY